MTMNPLASILDQRVNTYDFKLYSGAVGEH